MSKTEKTLLDDKIKKCESIAEKYLLRDNYEYSKRLSMGREIQTTDN